jgi:hypothetical protein
MRSRARGGVRCHQRNLRACACGERARSGPVREQRGGYRRLPVRDCRLREPQVIELRRESRTLGRRPIRPDAATYPERGIRLRSVRCAPSLCDARIICSQGPMREASGAAFYSPVG